MKTNNKRGFFLSIAAIAALAAGFWPEGGPTDLAAASAQPFQWDRAAMFATLERDFAAARTGDAEPILAEIEQRLTTLDASGPTDALAELERLQFRLGAIAAAHPELLARSRDAVYRIRSAVLAAARSWPTDRTEVHRQIYRILYGGRAAVEEALVQAGEGALEPLTRIEEIPSATPSTEVHGVRVHSGDVVLTRGGAPTSALIARGNDFPGNFSHAALVHVDGEGTASVIEALIEHGLVVSTLEQFLNDKKLRILLLRPRPGLVSDDPLAPHRAASHWLERAREEQIGYDFAMDWSNDREVFCSEVVYHAYREIGVELWRYRSTISSPGLVRWLGTLGVRNFVTLVPSDLEYDPQLAPVAEWRDPTELRRDRRDNAIIDALLEEAERGAGLGFAWYQLPAARALKAWSAVVSLLGGSPTIPDGMSGATAARVNGLRHQIFDPLREAVSKAEVDFREQNGFEPPYWRLVPLARNAVASHREQMAPALSLPTSE